MRYRRDGEKEKEKESQVDSSDGPNLSWIVGKRDGIGEGERKGMALL